MARPNYEIIDTEQVPSRHVYRRALFLLMQQGKGKTLKFMGEDKKRHVYYGLRYAAQSLKLNAKLVRVDGCVYCTLLNGVK